MALCFIMYIFPFSSNNIKGGTMKTLLLLFLLSSNQSIIYNTPTNQIYIIDPNSNPIDILILEENMYSNISCLKDETYLLKDINFSDNSSCLINTINHQLDLNIDHYVDLNDSFTKQDLKNIKKASISNLYKLINNIDHNYSIKELYNLYNQTKKNEFQYEIHYLTYIKFNDIYYPL